MKLYEPIEGKISSVDEKGHGVLVNHGKTVKAFFAIPHDTVKLTPTRRQKGELSATAEIIKASRDRVVPRCPYVGTCGGCLWQFVDYPKQLEYKRNLINEAFSKLDDPSCKIQEVVPARELFYYRNRMDYVVGPNGEVGLKAPGQWFSHLDLSECYLLSPEAVEIMKRFRMMIKKHDLKPWQSRDGSGFLRYLVIREGKRTGERALHIVTTSRGALPNLFSNSRELEKVLPVSLASHIVQGVNDSPTDLSIAETNIVFRGGLDFHEEFCGVRYTIPIGSFFQTNTDMAEQLFETVARLLDKPSSVLDLYCGVGFFTLGLAKRGIKCQGVELDPEAIRAAKTAQAENKIEAATFTALKAEALSWSQEKVEAVIIDPPRAGLHPKVIKTLLTMKPQRIIYVSCKYSRLVQELPSFLEHYTITGLEALDLFPHTPHVEVVVRLDRK